MYHKNLENRILPCSHLSPVYPGQHLHLPEMWWQVSAWLCLQSHDRWHPSPYVPLGQAEMSTVLYWERTPDPSRSDWESAMFYSMIIFPLYCGIPTGCNACQRSREFSWCNVSWFLYMFHLYVVSLFILLSLTYFQYRKCRCILPYSNSSHHFCDRRVSWYIGTSLHTYVHTDPEGILQIC